MTEVEDSAPAEPRTSPSTRPRIRRSRTARREKSDAAFRSIGETAAIIGVQPHVLRYWETQFRQLSPVKRADGRRYYRPQDVALAAGIAALVHDDGLSLKAAAKSIRADRGAEARLRGEGRIAELGGRASATTPDPSGKPAAPRRTAKAAAPKTTAPKTTAPKTTAPKDAAPQNAAPKDAPSPRTEPPRAARPAKAQAAAQGQAELPVQASLFDDLPLAPLPEPSPASPPPQEAQNRRARAESWHGRLAECHAALQLVAGPRTLPHLDLDALARHVQARRQDS